MREKKKNPKYCIPHESGYLEKIIDYILEMKKGKILDIPSGNLWLTKILHAHGFACTADDICYKVITKEMRELGVEYNCSNLDKELPYEDESFDYIVCFAGLEHIANPYVAVREFRRILKESGKLFIVIPNAQSVTSRIRFLLDGSLSTFPHIHNTKENHRHLHINPILFSQFRYICSEIGLDTVLIKPFDRIKFFQRIIFFPFVPILILTQHYFSRKTGNSDVKKF